MEPKEIWEIKDRQEEQDLPGRWCVCVCVPVSVCVCGFNYRGLLLDAEFEFACLSG